MRALIFENNKAPYFPETLRHFIRIPQVMSQINQVQEIWDSHFDSDFNFINRITLEGHLVLSNENLRSLLLGVVQIGFFHRYIMKNPYPQVVMGQVKGFSPVLSCLHKVKFEDVVLEFLKKEGFWKLSQRELTLEDEMKKYEKDEFHIFKLCEKNKSPTYEKMFEGDFQACMYKLIKDESFPSFVWIGNHSMIENLESQFKTVDFKDIVDLEPEFAKNYWNDLKESLESSPHKSSDLDH